MFRGEITNLNLPVVNVKKNDFRRETRRNFSGEKTNRLNVKIFLWPVKFRSGFAAKNHK